MANEIAISIILDDKGSLKLVAKEADKAASSVDNLAKSNNKASNSKNRFNKQEKGTAGITSNSTKAFAKQAQTLNGGGGGLVAAYATLAANVFAITAAFGVLQRAAGIQQLEAGLIFTGRAAGENLPMVVDRLKEITNGALATSDAMNSVALGVSAGFSETQLEGLTKVAKGASLALGRDMTDAMNRLVKGAAKLEPEILDELGIMVRLDSSTRAYAESVGKTAEELTQLERRMAFTNAIIEQGEIKFGALAEVIGVNPYDKLAASFDGLTKTVLNFLNVALKPVASFVADNITIVIGVFTGLATSIIRSLLPALTEAGSKMAELASKSAGAAKANIASVKSFDGAPAAYKKLTGAIQKGTASEKDMANAKNSLTRSIAMHNKQMDHFTKKHGEGSEAVKIKKEKLLSAETALKSITVAEGQSTVATHLNTRANLLNAAAHGEVSKALAALRLMWSTEIAATLASAAGKGFLTKSLMVLRTAFTLATVSAKAFGIAVLSAIPIIGQFILLGSMLWGAVSWMWESEPSALDKELEKVQERLEEFPKVIDQMANSYLVATSRVEKFVAAFRPLVGLSGQVESALVSLITVQRTEQLAGQIKLQKQILDKEAQIKALKDAEAENRKKNEWQESAGPMSVKGEDPEISALKGDLETLRNASIDTTATIAGAKTIMVGYSASLETARDFLEKGTSEYNLYTKSIEASAQVLELLNRGQLPEAIDMHKAITKELRLEKEALDTVKEESAKVSAFFIKVGQATGFFSERIELLSTSFKILTDAQEKPISPEILTMYEDLSKFRGIDFPELKVGEILTKEQSDLFRSQVDAVMKKMKELDKAAVDLEKATVQKERGALADSRKYGSEDPRAILTALSNAQYLQTETLRIEEERKNLLVEGTAEYDKQFIAVQKLYLEQEKLDQQKVSTATNATGSAANRIGVAAASGAFDIANQREKIGMIQNMVSPMMEDLAKLGPEGELVSAVAQGAFVVSSAWSNVGQVFADNASSMEKGAAVAQAVGQTFQQIGAIMSAQSNAEIATIDKQIDAEKKRDGKSKESLAKIQALESKKEQQKRKAFEANKKVMMATTVANTAAAMMTALAPPPAGLGPVFGPALAGIAGAMGAAQLAIISGTSYNGGGSSAPSMPSSISVGNRQNTVDLAKSKSPSGELAYARGASGTGNMGNFTPAFTGYRAAGGNTAFMVGEQGPELFVPDRPGNIVPADDTASMNTNPVNVSFNINAVDNRGVEELLVNQRGYIIGMIREAANAHGETFLEAVDERAYEMEK